MQLDAISEDNRYKKTDTSAAHKEIIFLLQLY